MEIKDLINDNVAFHCNTEEKAKEFVRKAYALGYVWCDGSVNDTHYSNYRNNSCYHLNMKRITYSEFGYFERYNYTIIEYELDEVGEKNMENKKLTPVEYIMWYYGVKEGEKFKVIYDDDGKESGYSPYVFEDGILRNKNGYISHIDNIIRRKVTIEKLPWKPNIDDLVWYIGEDRYVYNVVYTGIVSDLAMLKNGWLFRTKEEAKANMERLLKEYTEVLGND